ncbi:cobalamin-dependent protein [bacterium]|nr:cobalamin-dependent protein [bacterium]
MKFLLIFPDWGPFPLPYRRTIPPLSPATLAGILRHWGEVDYYDERLEAVPLDQTYDLVLITAMTNQVQRAYQLADHFRQQGTMVALGGVHTSLLPDEALNHANVIFVGEAEDTLPRFLDDLSKGVHDRRYQCQAPDAATLDRFTPERSIYLNKGYLPIDPIQFFRGCRLACEACSVPQTQGRIVLFRQDEAILSEIEKAQNYLFFINDDLYFHRKRLTSILESMRSMGRFWLGLGSTDMASDPKFLELMKMSGCWLLYLDFGPREAIAINQPERVPGFARKIADEIQRLKEHDIKLIGSFTFGYDFDTDSVFERTLDFCCKHGIDEAEFHLLVPYPRTRLAKKLEREGRILSKQWSQYTATHVVFQPKNMSTDQLLAGYHKTWASFYKIDQIVQKETFEIESFRAFPSQIPDKTLY